MSGGGGGGHATRLGLVRCEHCQRQFNPHSAARHIPWCKKQQGESKKHRLSADKLQALERYKWRISYKPTNKFKQINTSTGRTDKYAGNNYHKGVSSVNSSQSGAGTLSSPSASSTTSLSNSIASTSHHRQGFTLVKSQQQQQQQQQPPISAATTKYQNGSRKSTQQRDELKLRRSVSSVGLVKGRGGGDTGSASSKNSRISTTTTTIRALEPKRRESLSSRAKSVSDLAAASTNMSELVETLAKRMEQIYAQNQLLLESIITTGGAHEHCDRQEKVRAAIGRPRDEQELEFDQCHHCGAKCLVEANYCHKCGCKMRPSNPTPPPSD